MCGGVEGGDGEEGFGDGVVWDEFEDLVEVLRESLVLVGKCKEDDGP